MIRHLSKITKTAHTNHDRNNLKIGHDIIDKPVKLVILNKKRKIWFINRVDNVN